MADEVAARLSNPTTGPAALEPGGPSLVDLV